MADTTTIEHIRSLFTYDQLTGLIRSRFGRVVGTRDFEGYVRVSLVHSSTLRFRAHRLAVLAVLGRWPELDVDHINGIRHDNRWCNLREVSRSTNSQNQRRATGNNKTSGLLGVSYDKDRRRWFAQIQTKGKTFNLGRFDSPESAHEAYLNAKRQLHAGCTI
ncbi:MAG: HNH endonuclease [Paucibacter sp.]|nr:HNH endonuclease [Roseateles sp.]